MLNGDGTIGVNSSDAKWADSARGQFVRFVSQNQDFIVRLIVMRNAPTISSNELLIDQCLSVLSNKFQVSSQRYVEDHVTLIN